MSIIFKKLNTLKNDLADPEKMNREGLQNRTPVYSFKNLVFSPRGASIIAAILIGFGVISFYTLSFLKEYLDSASGNAIVVQRVKKGITQNSPAATGQAPPSETVAPEGSAFGLAPFGTESDPGASPDSEASQGTDSQDSAGFKVPKQFIRLMKKNPAEDSVSPAVSEKNTDAGLIYIPKLPLKDIQDKNPLTLNKKPAMTEPLIESGSPAAKKSKTSSIQEATAEIRIKAQEDILRAAKDKRTRKTSAVGLIADDLEESLEKNDITRTHALLNALAKENGQTSPYYLKLKAFQDIREENYDSAKKCLNQILVKDENDFDANYNLAVIEIREQRFDLARQRLTRLKEFYPSKAQIDDLLNSF